MNEFSKFRERDAEETRPEARQQEGSTSAEREFNTVEEMLQYDSDQNPLPEEVAHRVNESIRGEPPPGRSWWQKLFRNPNN